MKNKLCLLLFAALSLLSFQILASTINLSQYVENNTLDLSGINITDSDIPAVTAFLTNHPDVSGFKLNQNFGPYPISSAAIKLLAQNKTLTTLELNGSDIEVDTATALANNTTLKSLALNYTFLHNEGIMALAKNTTLKSLELYCTQSDDDVIVNAFATHPSLTSLEFTSGCWATKRLTDQGAKVLAANKILTRLSIGWGGQLTDEGYIALAHNEHLTSLRISSRINQKIASELASNPHLTKLTLDSLKDADAIALAHSSSLSELVLNNSDDLTDAGIVALAHNTHLTKLTVYKSKMTDVSALELAKNSSLTELDLELNDNVSDQAAIALAHNTSLKSLSLENVGDAGAAALANNPSITTLYLGYNDITDAGAIALAKDTHLIQLSLRRTWRIFEPVPSKFFITDVGAIAFANNTTLKKLNLEVQNIGTQGAIALAQNKTLTDLDIWGINQAGAEWAKAFATNTTLKKLVIAGNNLGDAGAVDIAKNTTLTFLEIGYNHIGSIGLAALGENKSIARIIGADSHSQPKQGLTLSKKSRERHIVGSF